MIAHHPLPILHRYEVNPENGCWEWLGGKIFGYGRCKIGGKDYKAHRVFYEKHVGSIPDGHVIHHRCNNRSCVNPKHLEPLDHVGHRHRHPR